MIVVWMQKPQVGVVVPYNVEGDFRGRYTFVWYLCCLSTRLIKRRYFRSKISVQGLAPRGITGLVGISNEEHSWSHRPWAGG